MLIVPFLLICLSPKGWWEGKLSHSGAMLDLRGLLYSPVLSNHNNGLFPPLCKFVSIIYLHPLVTTHFKHYLCHLQLSSLSLKSTPACYLPCPHPPPNPLPPFSPPSRLLHLSSTSFTYLTMQYPVIYIRSKAKVTVAPRCTGYSPQ